VGLCGLPPLLYARILGLCALVTIAFGVFEVGSRVETGVLLALLGAALIVGGSSTAAAHVD
jgi:hypothetical protein